MPLGTTLDELVEMVRFEAGHSASPSTGRNTDEAIRQHIRRTYRRIHAGYNWPHLRIERDEDLQAGERYYTLEPALNFQRAIDVWVLEAGGDTWTPVYYGIGFEHLNSINSDRDEREDPVRYWQVYEGGQYEVWPIPVTNDSKLRFIGFSAPKNLTSGNDTCDIDDDAVALFVAAEWLVRQQSSESELKLQQAQAHLNRLHALNSKNPVFAVSSGRRYEMGGGSPHIDPKAPGT